MKIILDYLLKRYYDIAKFSEVGMENAIARNTTELEQLEGVIERGLSTFYEVGRALMRIRDEQLYEKVRGIATFESYCKERWGFTRANAYYLIDAAKVEKNLSNTFDIAPSSLRQTIALAKLNDNPAQQRTAWQKAVETAPEGKVTAAHVYKIVKDMTEPTKKEQDKTEIVEDSDAIFHLKRWWKKATKKDRQIFLSWIESEG
jgi:hypothetical protein